MRHALPFAAILAAAFPVAGWAATNGDRCAAGIEAVQQQLGDVTDRGDRNRAAVQLYVADTVRSEGNFRYCMAALQRAQDIAGVQRPAVRAGAAPAADAGSETDGDGAASGSSGASGQTGSREEGWRHKETKGGGSGRSDDENERTASDEEGWGHEEDDGDVETTSPHAPYNMPGKKVHGPDGDNLGLAAALEGRETDDPQLVLADGDHRTSVPLDRVHWNEVQHRLIVGPASGGARQ